MAHFAIMRRWPGDRTLRRLPHHPHRRRIRGHGYFKRLGPGIVTGAADDDPSGIGTYSQVGAAYGLGLIWFVPLVAPMAAAVQETAGRLGLVTGRGLATLIRRHFPRWVLTGALALVILANTFNIAADVAAMAGSTRLVIDLPQTVLVFAYVALMMTLELTMPYHRYARVLRWLALSLLAYVFVLASANVDWSAVWSSLVSPSLVGGAGGIAALIAVFGTTVSPYLFFWQASEEVEEEADRHDPVDVDHMSAMRIDVIGGMVSAVLIAFAIVVVAASTLHPAGITTIATPDQAAQALEPLVGHAAGLVFTLGIVGLGLLSVPVLAGSTAYAVAESFDWHEGLSERLRDARGFYAVVAASMLTGTLITVVGLDPIRALYLAAILNGLAAPPLIALMLVLGRRDRTLGRFRSGGWSMAIVGTTLLISIALPIAYLAAR
jgi:NRAMP (natural resistance-associated macrophage protein)-like metal ion transporter